MPGVLTTVKKIKKFRVEARPSAILRHLRALNLQATPELEKDVEAEAKAAQNLISTAALYQTFDAAQAPAWAASPGDQGEPVAFTLFAATVGADLEGEIAGAISRGEDLRGRVLAALGEDLADQAAHFVSRLVAEEAKGDSCILSERFTAPASELLTLLEASRISIRLDDAGRLIPRFTRLGYMVWWPPAKKRK